MQSLRDAPIGGAPAAGCGSKAWIGWPEREEVVPGVAFFATRPEEGWTALPELPLVILFGTTGVGKSTLLLEARDGDLGWRELPGRRSLTSRLVVAPQQRAEGREPTELPRLERYRYVRAFRERHPGGMAALLGHLAVDRSRWPGTLVFDGLRGRVEAEQAVRSFPRARFLVLDCPDAVRLERLIDRRDPHDRAATIRESEDAATIEELLPPELASRLSSEVLARWSLALKEGSVVIEELRTKLAILAEDLRTHDPEGTSRRLVESCPDRTLVLDTSRLGPEEVLDRVVGWMRRPREAMAGRGESA